MRHFCERCTDTPAPGLFLRFWLARPAPALREYLQHEAIALHSTSNSHGQIKAESAGISTAQERMSRLP